MQFRHLKGVRLALISGHTTFVGPEWRSLSPAYHTEALAKGCECDQTTIRTTELTPPVAGEGAVTPLDEPAVIREKLIVMVERNGADDFTNAGTPNLKTLAKECGFKVDKEVALGVWHQLEEEAKQVEQGEGEDA